jgi:hypothetical protein
VLHQRPFPAPSRLPASANCTLARVSRRVLVRYRHEFSHGLGLSPVELVLHQRPFPASVGEVSDGFLLACSFRGAA